MWKVKFSAWGWDEFPEDWGEFIDYMNGLCGGEYLRSEGEVVEVTPELLTEIGRSKRVTRII